MKGEQMVRIGLVDISLTIIANCALVIIATTLLLLNILRVSEPIDILLLGLYFGLGNWLLRFLFMALLQKLIIAFVDGKISGKTAEA